MSLPRYNFRSRSGSGESNSTRESENNLEEGRDKESSFDLFATITNALDDSQPQPYPEEGSLTQTIQSINRLIPGNLFECTDLQEECTSVVHVNQEPDYTPVPDSPILATQDVLQQLDASLQPKLLGCGTQVSDSAVSQALNQLRALAEPPAIEESANNLSLIHI